MKTMQMLATGVAISVVAYSNFGYAVTVDSTPSKTQVEFVESEDFTDIKNDKVGSSKGEAYILEEIDRVFRESASRKVPDGYTLKIKVRDVDLAGDYEPQPPNWGDIRVLREIYPPRIVFDYELIDANEQVVASGNEALSDNAYRQRIRMAQHSDQAAPYVAELIRNWSSRSLGREVAMLD